MNFPEAKEYVQQQLQLMGVGEISQKELERYTRDFIQLLKEKETTNKFEEESVEDTSDDSESTTSLYHVAKQQATPTPDKVVEVSVSRVDGKVIKRKTLRTPIRSVMETTKDFSTDISRPSSSENECPKSKPPPLKSFIRPRPHTRGFQKCDPVQRYHEFREMWENQKPPGEKSRNSLRWQIRERLLQDAPLYVPSHPIRRPNDYVVPTDKKRQRLRWEVRHHMSQINDNN